MSYQEAVFVLSVYVIIHCILKLHSVFKFRSIESIEKQTEKEIEAATALRNHNLLHVVPKFLTPIAFLYFGCILAIGLYVFVNN